MQADPRAVKTRGYHSAMPLFALTVFLSAFLLFQVQPLLGRFVLPWFGGAPATWTTCLLFFQLALLAGYAWADLLQRLPPRRQAIVHVLLLAASVACVPIAPSPDLRPVPGQDPTPRLLALLALAAGVPYIALASTGPLVQAWFARVRPGGPAYRLYALSNVGSLLGLATYPALVEPTLRLGDQVSAWSTAFVVFAAGCVACALAVFRSTATCALPIREDSPARAGAGRVFLWIAIPFATSALLLASTQQLCQDVAPVPFLWVLPLGLYLLSFVVAFGVPKPPSRPAVAAVVVPSLLVDLYATWNVNASLLAQLTGRSAALFSLCLAAHAELVRARPHARGPTRFYLAVAAGSALGAIAVALVAPRVFDEFREYPLSLCATAALAAGTGIRATYAALPGRGRGPDDRLHLAVGARAPALAIGLYASALAVQATHRRTPVETVRNFYGVLHVSESGEPGDPLGDFRRSLLHGRTLHGFQFLGPHLSGRATAYYAEHSGIAEAIRLHPQRAAGRPLAIGVVGLGVGTIAALARDGDRIEFYEINPAVVEIAGNPERFTFLADAAGRGVSIEVHLGDARRTLELQLARHEPRRFDVLAVDAFSSDAIPVHLLTRECAVVYAAHLAPGGVLAFHVSNQHVDLAPVVHGLAEALGATASDVAARSDRQRGAEASDWILVTRDATFHDALLASDARVSAAAGREGVLWTDDFSSLLPVLR